MCKAKKLKAIREILDRATTPHDSLTVAHKLSRLGFRVSNTEVASLLQELEAFGLLVSEVKLTPGGGTYMFRKARQLPELQYRNALLTAELASLHESLRAIARSRDGEVSSQLAKGALDSLARCCGRDALRNFDHLVAKVVKRNAARSA